MQKKSKRLKLGQRQPQAQGTILSANQNAFPSSTPRKLGLSAVRSKNERVELEMKIMRYRQLASRTADEEFVRRIRDHIAELEQKLREIDE